MIYKNISREEYEALPGVNASTLKPYYESSLNGNYENAKERIETPAMRFGTAFHCNILEPHKFVDIYAEQVLPINEKTGKEYGIDTKKAQEYLAGLPKDKKYLSLEELDRLGKMAENLFCNNHAMEILDSCPDREMGITWVDPNTGMQCKALIDFVGDNMAGDIKTCREIKWRNNEVDIAKAIRWEIIGNKNLLQFAFYNDGLKANDINIESFVAIFAQNCGNHETLAAILSEDSIEYGRCMYNRALVNYTHKEDNKSAFDFLLEI